MKLQYIVTPISGLVIAGRWLHTVPLSADGRRRISLEQEAAQIYVDSGWLVVDGSAPPAVMTEAERAPEYDFRGSTIRDARPPTNKYAANHTLSDPAKDSDKGAILLIDSATAVVITLPKNWLPGDGCVIRRVGAGDVTWALEAGATKALPASRSTHTKIAERHTEILVRVIDNADGVTAVWAIEGATA